MANILDRYGIKEVADVMFYQINEDGTAGAPVLYLDTLKVSTIEQTANSADARGGKGNPALISWDYGKEITVTLEDALFSAKSMAIMFGNGKLSDESTLLKTVKKDQILSETVETVVKYYVMMNDKKVELTLSADTTKFYDELGGLVTKPATGLPDAFAYCTFSLAINGGKTITIGANTFPGTYYVTGDTYARSEATGKDEFFQFIINKAKVQAENTITLQADGDPSTFNMNLKVLRPANGVMMKLVKYDVTGAANQEIL